MHRDEIVEEAREVLRKGEGPQKVVEPVDASKSRMVLPEGVFPEHLDFHPNETPCTECGACCVLVDEQAKPNHAYVEMVEADFVNMNLDKNDKKLFHRRAGNSPGSAHVFLRLVQDDHAERAYFGHRVQRCRFLVGDVGEASCGVYNNRPHACRVYPKNSWDCAQQRRRHYMLGNQKIQPRFVGGRMSGKEEELCRGP